MARPARSTTRTAALAGSSLEAELQKLLPDFSEFQARLQESILARKTASHRIQVQVTCGAVAMVQQTVEERRDFARRSNA